MFGWHDPMAMDLASVRTRRPKLRSTKTERMDSRSMDYKTCSGTPSALGAPRLPGTLITLPHLLSRSAQRSLIVRPPSLTENGQPKDLPHARPRPARGLDTLQLKRPGWSGRHGRQRPWSTTATPCAGKHPCSTLAWLCSAHRSGQPGCSSDRRRRTICGRSWRG